MLRTGTPSQRQARHGRTVSPAAKLKEQIDLLRQRYWFFMSQNPPRVKAASACLIALRPLMQKQIERECRADRRHRPEPIAQETVIDIDDCTEVYGQ